MQKKIALVITIGIIVAVISTATLVMQETNTSIILERESHQTQVNESVKKTVESFDGDLESVVLSEGKYYSFVLNEKLQTILLHPRAELVNTAPNGLNNANITIDQMIEQLDEKGNLWVHYEFMNPETGNVEPKSTYLVKHEGYVFGAGYYSP